jgi:starvation-inducible DNA-binding protein
MMHIGLEPKTCEQVAGLLNKLLSNEFILYTKTLKVHWNVEGKHFGSLHEFFKQQYEAMLDIVDEVAERARALGVMSFGTIKEFAQHGTLPEHPGENPDDLGMILWLLQDHEAIIRQLRKDVDTTAQLNDMGTNNFLAGLMERHEKMAWMLRSFLLKNK